MGARVTLRRRLPEGGYADTVGHLLSWSGGVLAVRRRTGETVEVADDDVVASKVVPTPAPRSRPPRS